MSNKGKTQKNADNQSDAMPMQEEEDEQINLLNVSIDSLGSKRGRPPIQD